MSWPNGLQSLTFGFSFNQTLERVSLPSCLQSLTFGCNFNQSLTGVILPSSLQSLTFGDHFNQTLEEVSLPNSLQILTFGVEFNQDFEGSELTKWSAKLDIWLGIQPNLGWSEPAKQLANLFLRCCISQHLVSFRSRAKKSPDYAQSSGWGVHNTLQANVKLISMQSFC